ncbi:DUF2634 domain-containing protein [Exiguobacterium sp. MH3]|uniref:DUF2634 domain-containing protein n=1 Tax=Exiguobacterium sp. MH3 TaxID=1399115 RepID=UPI0003C4083A|nr:DUF2634 domain-containing protein [Exiguobacterium sp. MH3]AHA31318.1 hypothetical protein U719_06750 [Exiguobacterium sp. MH3]
MADVEEQEGLLPEVDVDDVYAEEETEQAGGKLTPLFDFETGEFVKGSNDEILVDDGIEGLKNVISKMILTSRDAYPIYSEDYGCEAKDDMRLDVSDDVKRLFIADSLMDTIVYDDRIVSVDEVDVIKVERRFEATIDLNTIVGETTTTEQLKEEGPDGESIGST